MMLRKKASSSGVKTGSCDFGREEGRWDSVFAYSCIFKDSYENVTLFFGTQQYPRSAEVVEENEGRAGQADLARSRGKQGYRYKRSKGWT